MQRRRKGVRRERARGLIQVLGGHAGGGGKAGGQVSDQRGVGQGGGEPRRRRGLNDASAPQRAQGDRLGNQPLVLCLT